MPLLSCSCFDFPCFTSIVSGILDILVNCPAIMPLFTDMSTYFEGILGSSSCCPLMTSLNPTPSPDETILTDGSIKPPTGGGVLSFFEGIPSEAKILIAVVVVVLVGYGISRLIKGKKPPIQGGE